MHSCGTWCFGLFQEWQKCICVCSQNILARVGRTMWITVAISNINTDACLEAGAWSNLDVANKHPSICNFVPIRSLPLSDNPGGFSAFSCMKNEAIFQSCLAWREVNICITTAAVDLYDSVLLPNFGKLTGSGWKTMYMWGVRIMSESGMVHYPPPPPPPPSPHHQHPPHPTTSTPLTPSHPQPPPNLHPPTPPHTHPHTHTHTPTPPPPPTHTHT